VAACSLKLSLAASATACSRRVPAAVMLFMRDKREWSSLRKFSLKKYMLVGDFDVSPGELYCLNPHLPKDKAWHLSVSCHST
jgi:hypothetical protein